jgi:hypothetical protein
MSIHQSLSPFVESFRFGIVRPLTVYAKRLLLKLVGARPAYVTLIDKVDVGAPALLGLAALVSSAHALQWSRSASRLVGLRKERTENAHIPIIWSRSG